MQQSSEPDRATSRSTPDGGGTPQVQAEVITLLAAGTAIDTVARQQSYAATRTDDLALVIVTGDERWQANVLLTIGPVPEEVGSVAPSILA